MLSSLFDADRTSNHRSEILLVAGPCVIESREETLEIAEELVRITADLPVRTVFKASYLKANRSHPESYAGPGLEEGIEILQVVRDKTGLPVLSDIHCREEIDRASKTLDILQIPAYLCRQTRLIQEASRTGKIVNIKKGQFMAPEDMEGAVKKAVGEGNPRVMLTERGTFFGYRNLVVDFRSISIMKKFGYPVLFDGTHSVQRPGGEGNASGGDPEFISPLCRAAAAVGVDGFYLEVHREPSRARSDSSSMLALDRLPGLLEEILRVREATRIDGS